MWLLKAILTVLVALSAVNVHANPLAKTESRTILELMASDPKVCNFPPRDLFLKPPRFLAPCSKEVPSVEASEIRQYAEEADDDYAFLCMGFYDLSLRICSSQINTVPPLFNDTAQLQNMFNDHTRDDQFCSDLRPYLEVPDSGSQPGPISNWVAVLNTNLADQETCTSWCLHRKTRSVHTICKILLWGRKLLHEMSRNFVPNPQLTATVAQGQPEEPQVSQEQSTYLEQDLEAKDVTNDSRNTMTFGQEQAPISQPASEPVYIPQQITAIKSAAQPSSPQANSSTEVKLPLTAPKDENSSKTPVSKVVVVTPKETPKHSSPSVAEEASPVQQQSQLQTNKSSSSTSSSSTSTSQTPLIATDFQQPNEEDANQGSNEQYTDGAGANGLDEEDEGFSTDIKESSSQIGISPVGGLEETTFPRGSYHSFTDTEDSHFFAYFLTLVVLCMVAYVVFHNKQKIFALALEGRRGGRSSRRRPSTSNYRKLDSNLEEAISSAAPRTNPHVIY